MPAKITTTINLNDQAVTDAVNDYLKKLGYANMEDVKVTPHIDGGDGPGRPGGSWVTASAKVVQDVPGTLDLFPHDTLVEFARDFPLMPGVTSRKAREARSTAAATPARPRTSCSSPIRSRTPAA